MYFHYNITKDKGKIDHLSFDSSWVFSLGFGTGVALKLSKLLGFWDDIFVCVSEDDSSENPSFKKPEGLRMSSVYGGGWCTF